MKGVLHIIVRNEKGENQITLNMWMKYAGFFGTYYLIRKEKGLFVCFLLGNYPGSGVFMPTFQNILFHLHRQVDVSRMN